MSTDPNIPDDLWLLMREEKDYSGLCDDMADLMTKAMKILGASADTGYVYGSTDSDCYSTSSNAREQRTCPGGEHGNEQIWLYFNGFGGWNSYEAVCEVVNEQPESKYYAVKVTSNTSPLGVLRSLLAANDYQAWLYHWGDPWDVCTDPGPYPVPVPDE